MHAYYFFLNFVNTAMKREDNIDYHIRSTWYALARMYGLKAAKFDFTMSEGFVLLNVDRETGTPATKIAPMMGLEARSLTRILKNLEERGFIYKVKDEKDGRSVRICLTDEGEEGRRIASEVVKSFNNKLRNKFSISELNTFFKVMADVLTTVETEVEIEKEQTFKTA